jgi:hypothetical protein
MTLEACATGIVAVGCLAAVAGVLAGNRTAYALLASAIFSTVLCEAGVPFRPSLWLAIDLAVIMWMVVSWAESVLQGRYGKQRDIAVLALFAPIWALYFADWLDWRALAIDFLVAAQMLLTFPFRRAFLMVRDSLPVADRGDGPLRFAVA